MAGCFAGFLVILYFVLTGENLIFDAAITGVIYPIRNDFLTVFMKGITYLGNWQSITILCLILLLIPQTRKNFGIPVSIGAAFVTLLNKIIKVIIARPRPDVSLHLIEQEDILLPAGIPLPVCWYSVC